MGSNRTVMATVLIISFTATALAMLFIGLGNLAHATPDPAAPQLLLTEIVVTPTEGEFIEIHNPTGQIITLTDVYLTDATNAGTGNYYYNIVTGASAGGAGGGGSDFHARFPPEATIGPGEYQTIALRGSANFSTTYGLAPTYELSEDESTPDAIPDMLEVLPGSIGGQAGLTDSGEVVILYFWDGTSDLVTDLDYVVWGDKAEAVDKTGVSIDGPDEDDIPGTYLADTAIDFQDVLGTGNPLHTSITSVQRKDLAEGTETRTGGNGAAGDDETSEDLSNTWCKAAPSPNAATSCRDTPTISKQAPPLVEAGERFTYTITVENNLGYLLSDLLIADVIPTNVIFAESESGIPGPDKVISWTISSLANGEGIAVTYAVTASNSLTTVTNTNYRITATNFTTPTIGDPVTTLVLPPELERVAIHDIQGADHISPFNGQPVQAVHGVVTAVRPPDGFYMQDSNPDANEATSEGILVKAGGINVSDEVFVSGVVNESVLNNDLSVTQIITPTVVISSSGNALPPATTIGVGGRIPPTQVIDDDGLSSFEPITDGLDFYESLEGMLAQVNEAHVVGPTSGPGEIVVVSDNGVNASPLTARGGLFIQPQDFNPERIIIDDDLISTAPQVNVGDRFTAPITGVLDYSFGNFKLLNSEALPSIISGGLTMETTTPLSAALRDNQLAIASYNVSNLSPGDEPARFATLASQIVDNLAAPDIIALQEIQDNSGLTNDGTVSASDTYQALIEAITAASGPTYDFREIAPEDLQDGGEPGANIRVGFLFRPDRVTFVDRGNATATEATSVTFSTTGLELSLSPGRIDPTNSAFADTPKSLAGEFLFNDHKIFVINNHFNSKQDDDPLFGSVQPPVRHSEIQRAQIAQVINDFVDNILAQDAEAKVIVLGDLNDFPFSQPISDTLTAGVLTNLASSLPAGDQYTFILDGNSQMLDYILVSNSLNQVLADFDIVHTNTEFSIDTRPSDHDPILVRLNLLSEPSIYLPFISR